MGRTDPAGGARTEEVCALLARVRSWTAERPDVSAVGLAGSWARAAAGPDSDVDLVVLTERPRAYSGLAWTASAVGDGASDIRTRQWGPVLERRVALPSGLEVEFGFAPPSWAAVEPVDPGTARVVTDGFVILRDPSDLLGRLVNAVAERS